MTTTFRAAIAGACVLAAISLSDAVHHGLTGRYSALSDDRGTTTVWLLGNLAHGLTYLALAAVLIAGAGRIDTGGRVRRGVRLGLVACFAALAAHFLVGAPLLFAQDADLDSPPLALEVLLVAFPLMFVLALAFGLVTRRGGDVQLASRVLCAIVPVAAFTALLAVVAPDFAHPAYLETTVNFGVALVGMEACVGRRAAVPV